ncbi:hypothetical protein LIER_38107 [Lithospermum erythrorhizon]|uniref:Uncharacterized protein n=1 Tax=Lithospermum erythrorhizon TaxID=34254 RepID=A0AAV3PUW8_LITER
MTICLPLRDQRQDLRASQRKFRAKEGGKPIIKAVKEYSPQGNLVRRGRGDSWRRRLVRHVEGNPQRLQGLKITSAMGKRTTALRTRRSEECSLGLRVGCEPGGNT